MDMNEVQEYISMFEQLEDEILKAVNNSTGIKGTELALRVLTAMMPLTYKTDEYVRIVNMLVDIGKIVEIEYTVPGMSYRIKSIYFPAGTHFDIKVGLS